MTHDECPDCHGLGFEDCDDPLGCMRRGCDGELHDCRTCRGTGEIEIDEEDDHA